MNSVPITLHEGRVYVFTILHHAEGPLFPAHIYCIVHILKGLQPAVRTPVCEETCVAKMDFSHLSYPIIPLAVSTLIKGTRKNQNLCTFHRQIFRSLCHNTVISSTQIPLHNYRNHSNNKTKVDKKVKNKTKKCETGVENEGKQTEEEWGRR